MRSNKNKVLYCSHLVNTFLVPHLTSLFVSGSPIRDVIGLEMSGSGWARALNLGFWALSGLVGLGLFLGSGFFLFLGSGFN